MAFEPVYTVWDYYDGPRSGFAGYSGKPYHYRCEWNESDDDYASTFILTPVDDETFSLVLEQEAIWQDWNLKFHHNQVLQSTHPALPGQHSRFAELTSLINKRVSEFPEHGKRAQGDFRPLANQSAATTGVKMLEVEWNVISTE